MRRIKRLSAFFAAVLICILMAMPLSAEFIQDEEGREYYVKEDGSFATGLYYTTFKEFSRMCSYDDQGVFKGYYTGFTKSKAGRRYYFNGEMYTGWQKIAGDYYHFNENGVADTGKVKIGGCTYYFGEKGAWTGKRSAKGSRPDDFAVSFIEGYGGDIRLSTEKNVIEKLIDYDECASAEYKFTKMDLQVIWSIISEYDLLSADTGLDYGLEYAWEAIKANDPDDDRLLWGGVEPCSRFTVTITADGESYTFKGTEELKQAVAIDKTAEGLWSLQTYLKRLIINSDEYKNMPESQLIYV